MSTELTPTQRKFLKGLAHPLKPVVQVGKNGVTERLIETVSAALDDHELIKVKFIDFKEEREELTDEILKGARAEKVAILGNIAILYREQRSPEKEKIIFPKK